MPDGSCITQRQDRARVKLHDGFEIEPRLPVVEQFHRIFVIVPQKRTPIVVVGASPAAARAEDWPGRRHRHW